MVEHSRPGAPEITTTVSPRSVGETVERCKTLLLAKGLTLFAVIDQAGAAEAVGMTLRPTTLVLFGDPAAGTPVMDVAPLSALDLPLEMLVWQDGATTKVSYLAPAALGARYGLDAAMTMKLAGIDAISDALVAP